ncbi:hypothetical protein PMAYCL1PPCAC_19322, partial [Pristionchus mayeri]
SSEMLECTEFPASCCDNSIAMIVRCVITSDHCVPPRSYFCQSPNSLFCSYPIFSQKQHWNIFPLWSSSTPHHSIAHF